MRCVAPSARAEPVGTVRAMPRALPLLALLAPLALQAPPAFAAPVDAADDAAPPAGPPEPYVDAGACPFECCSYGAWTALREAPLVARPDSDEVVARVKACEPVVAVTGEVRLSPVPVEVLRAHRSGDGRSFAPGDRFELLTPVGEGFFRARPIGGDELFTVDASGILDRAGCEQAPGRCWALRRGEAQRTWWIQIETAEGAIGWSRDAELFDGKDLCAVPDPACDTPPRRVAFRCPGDESFAVVFREEDAVLERPGQPAQRLPRQPSASGAQYGSDGTRFWTRGDQARLEVGGELVARGCRASR